MFLWCNQKKYNAICDALMIFVCREWVSDSSLLPACLVHLRRWCFTQFIHLQWGGGEILDNWAFFVCVCVCVCVKLTQRNDFMASWANFFFILEPNIWHYFIIFSIWKIDWTFLSLYIHSKAMDKISYPPYMYLYKYIVITYSICVLRVLKPPWRLKTTFWNKWKLQ